MFCEKMLFFDARIRLAGLNRIKPVISHRVNHFGSGNKCIPLTTLPPSLPSKSTRSEYLYLFVGQWGVIAVAVSNHFLTSFPACSALHFVLYNLLCGFAIVHNFAQCPTLVKLVHTKYLVVFDDDIYELA